MTPAALRQLAVDAWTQGDAMRVLADHLMEVRIIVLNEQDITNKALAWGHTKVEQSLYDLETEVRCWILNSFHPETELRVTAGWPDILYVAHRHLTSTDGWPSQTRVVMFGVERQPRLMREEVTP